MNGIDPPFETVTPEQQLVELMQRLRARWPDGIAIPERFSGQLEAIDAALTTLARMRGEELSGADLFELSAEWDARAIG